MLLISDISTEVCFSSLFLVWFCPALMCSSFKGQIMLNLHLYGINHQKFKQLEMSSYQSGFCFEEPFKEKLGLPQRLYLILNSFFFPPKKEVKKREKPSTNAFCKKPTPKQKGEDKQGQERKVSDKRRFMYKILHITLGGGGISDESTLISSKEKQAAPRPPMEIFLNMWLLSGNLLSYVFNQISLAGVLCTQSNPEHSFQ